MTIKREDIKIGYIHGKRTIISDIYIFRHKEGNRKYVDTQCNCGNVDSVLVSLIVQGKSLQCENCLSVSFIKYENLELKKREYKLWFDIKDRIFNINHKRYFRYGGRGLKMEESWINSFDNFYNYLKNTIGSHPGDGYSLDRINNNLGYIKNNIRWSSAKQQANNRNTTIFITYNNETKNLSDWSEKIGLPVSLLSRRYRDGWDLNKLFSQPIRSKTNKNPKKNQDRHIAYVTWYNFRDRILNPNNIGYINYGGMGLEIENDWVDSFDNFYNYLINNIGLRPSSEYSLDRINTRIGYIQGNLRWVTKKEQCRNKTDNRLITYNNETKTLAEWSEIVKVHQQTISNRIDKLKWPLGQALGFEPRQKPSKKKGQDAL